MQFRQATEADVVTIVQMLADDPESPNAAFIRFFRLAFARNLAGRDVALVGPKDQHPFDHVL